ncbi:hypothetical protein CCH79_00016549, partial [Gambusia affinis]
MRLAEIDTATCSTAEEDTSAAVLAHLTHMVAAERKGSDSLCPRSRGQVYVELSRDAMVRTVHRLQKPITTIRACSLLRGNQDLQALFGQRRGMGILVRCDGTWEPGPDRSDITYTIMMLCINNVHLYKNSLTLVNTFGFSVVTFSGTVGGGMEPRTSSKSFQLDEDDRHTIEELRAWAACQAGLSSVSVAVPLSAVQPNAYFDLICQLLAKASIDSTCTLLRVWDGTKCPHALLKVIAEPNCTEGPSSFSKHKESHIANVLVYDNHVEFSKHLKFNLNSTSVSMQLDWFWPQRFFREEEDH